MASRDINELVEGTRKRAKMWVEGCAKRGVDVLVYCTVRDPYEQARLYRQSRTTAQIEDKAQQFRALGMGRLADILHVVGPQFGQLGKHVTNAGPGESWHQYHLAWDAVPMVDGEPDWGMANTEAWQVMAEEAKGLGIAWAGAWVRFREYVHYQDAPAVNPLEHFGVDQVYAALGIEEG